MAVEARRKCGHRKVGGLYLVSDGLGVPCCKLPVLLHVCPTCNGGIKQSRGWTWIDPQPWLKGACTQGNEYICAAANPERFGDKVGLLWIGEQFYPTPSSFQEEAAKMGISRRITAVPRGFKVGEHFVFLAHPKMKEVVDPVTSDVSWVGGVFHVVKPQRIEKIITHSQSLDEKEMKKLAAQGITPVIVPDNDSDHHGSVYDDRELGDLFAA
jgi:hypothetical protein